MGDANLLRSSLVAQRTSNYKELRNIRRIIPAKDVVLAKKPVISHDSNQVDLTLLDELLSNITILSVVDYKPPEEFITHVKTTQKIEDEAYADASEQGYSDSPALVADSGVSPPASKANAQHPKTRQPADLQLLYFFLLDLGIDNSNSVILSADQPATPVGPPSLVVLPTSSGQGLQISAHLVRRDG
ncbi:Beta-adaptin-like protein C [Capsicum baccatum]|uniref:Beta-adaptin-like protein C n=1 Tax=Capsicum baccatum TaxID=33114 RepID=A0A2G2WIK4_CAPBA|nr:Beta-adaptin-like protein C [Capsicum baccatum]